VCPACGGATTLAFSLPDRGVFACRQGDCSLRFADPQPSDDQLTAFYADFYYGCENPMYDYSPESYLEQVLA
jgi:hypothetical protein